MGTVVSNAEYFRTNADIDLTQNVAIYKELVVTNYHATNAITITLSQTQTHSLPALETVELFYNGTEFIVFNEIGVDETLQTHINNSGASGNPVHGVNQLLSTTSSATFANLSVSQTTGNIPYVNFQEGGTDRFKIGYDEPNDNLRIYARNDDGTSRDIPVTIPRTNDGEIVFDRPIQCTSIDTGDGNFEIGNNLRTTDSPTFRDLTLNSIASTDDIFLSFNSENNRKMDIVYDAGVENLYFQARDDDGTFRDNAMYISRTTSTNVTFNRGIEVNGDIEIRSNGTDTFGLLKYQDDGLDRFFVQHHISNDALQIVTRNDDGSFRDVVMAIPRTQDAEMTIYRPLQINGDLDLQSNDITSGTFQGANKVTTITSNPTDAEIPSAEAVVEYVTAVTGGTITGDAIPAGSKLISDGTPVVYTSDFDYPITSITSFVPSTIEVDNLYYDNTNNVKFAGQRWMKGIFDEYENIIDTSSLPSASANSSVSIEDNWIRVEATSTVTDSFNTAATYIISALSNVGSISVLVKRGGSTPTTQIDLRTLSAESISIKINWAAKTFTHTTGVNTSKSFFLSDDIAFVSVVGTITGSILFLLYAQEYATATSGNYSLFKNVSLIDESYPAPYVDGIHEADNLSYDLNWGSEGTLEFWIDIQYDYDPSADIIYFGNRIASSTTSNVIQLYYDTSNSQFVFWLGDSTGVTHNYKTNAYTSGTWLSRGFHHFKVTYSTTDEADIQLKIDGSADLITVRPAITGSYSFLPYITIGSRYPTTGPTGYINSLIDDILWQPTVDTTTTHYSGGNPYIKSNKIYGGNGNYSVDEQGNVVASSFRDNEDLNFLEPLPEGDVLVFDGTVSSNDSRGGKPLQGFESFYFTPATLVIDDELYDNPFVKFPGLRGTKGIFENFPNQISQNYQEWSGFGGASRKGEGEWIVIENNATATDYVVSNAITASGDYQTLWRMIIKNVDATTTNVNFSGIGDIDITWGSSRSVSYTSPTEDLNTQFISNDIIAIVVKHDATGASPHIRITSDPNNANRTVKVKEILAVNFGNETPWEFPFFEYERPADQLTYNHNWGQQGTVEFWAQITFGYDVADNRRLFNNTSGNALGINEITFLYSASADEFLLYMSNNNSSITSFQFITPTYNSSTFPSLGFHHFKLTYHTSDNSEVRLFIDGEQQTFTERNTTSLSGTFEFEPYIAIGHRNVGSPTEHWNGYITDFRWSPTIDTSNTHYHAGVPYYIPSKKYSKDGSYSRDEYGNLTVTDIEGVNIPGEFEAIWDGNDAAPSIFLESGFYLFQYSENQAASPLQLISCFIRFDRSANILHRGACYTTNNGTIIPQITNQGVPTLDRTGSQFPNRRYRKIWRLKQ